MLPRRRAPLALALALFPKGAGKRTRSAVGPESAPSMAPGGKRLYSPGTALVGRRAVRRHCHSVHTMSDVGCVFHSKGLDPALGPTTHRAYSLFVQEMTAGPHGQALGGRGAKLRKGVFSEGVVVLGSERKNKERHGSQDCRSKVFAAQARGVVENGKRARTDVKRCSRVGI